MDTGTIEMDTSFGAAREGANVWPKTAMVKLCWWPPSPGTANASQTNGIPI